MARGTTEGCMSIDVRSWHREGRLRAGQSFLHSLTWMWQPTQGIGVLTKADAVYLMFRSRSWQHEYGPTITQRVPIAWTPCTLGGRRPWFRCEAYPNSKYCGRRKKRSYIIRFATFRPCQRPLEAVKCPVEVWRLRFGGVLLAGLAWTSLCLSALYPGCNACRRGLPYVGRRGGILRPFLPWAGIWKRCQMFTANCSEWRASDVVGRPPRRVRDGVSDNIRERNSPGSSSRT
jgi:hypothetical protein